MQPVVSIEIEGEIHRLAWADAIRINDGSPEKDLVASVSLLAEASILAAEAEYHYDEAYNRRKEVYSKLFAEEKERGTTDRAAESEARASRLHASVLDDEASAKYAMNVAQAVRASLQTKVHALRTILYRE